MILETCEFCDKEKSATYSQIGVGILGAAMCPRCKKITQTANFRTELAHMLATGNGDLDKFFKLDQKLTPVCNKCGCDLKASNWSPSDQKDNRHICVSCKNSKRRGRTHQNEQKKPITADNTKLVTPGDLRTMGQSIGSQAILCTE